MTKQGRLTLLVIAILTGLIICAVPMMLKDSGTSDSGHLADETTTAAPAETITSTGVQCPQPGDGSAQLATDAPLAKVRIPCLTNGQQDTEQTTLADALAGKPTVLNIWAWWCQPCRAELPYVAQLAADHPEWNVVGIHADPRAQAGLDMLSELKVDNLPSYQDADNRVAGAAGVPSVIPTTVVVRPDGTIAARLVQVFGSEQELETAVTQALNGAA